MILEKIGTILFIVFIGGILLIVKLEDFMGS
jgi:uncharacterized membrane protein